jgi:hypothetical protein
MAKGNFMNDNVLPLADSCSPAPDGVADAIQGTILSASALSGVPNDHTELTAKAVLASSALCRQSAQRALNMAVPDQVPLNRRIGRLILAAASSVQDRIDEVRESVQHEFLSVFGEFLVLLRQTEADVVHNYLALSGLERGLSRIAKDTDPYLYKSAEGKPWTWGARLSVASLVILSLVMIAVGLNTVAVVLMNSGLRGFEDPARAYLFSLVILGVAAGLKSLQHFLKSDSDKRVYSIGGWSFGLALGLTWAVLFARIFDGMAIDAATLINGLTSSGATEPPRNGYGWCLILAGLLAEAFLAAGSWLTVEAIAKHHQSQERFPNQAHAQAMRDLSRVSEARLEAGHWLGRVRGLYGAEIRLGADS